MVLLTACLDALAKHWDSTARPVVTETTPRNAADRMRMFLQQHAQHPAFAKVSAPLLRASDQRTHLMLESRFPFARYCKNGMNEVATWKDDPDFADLEREEDEGNHKLLINCSYGGILYKELRCAWLHKFLPESEQIVTLEDDHRSSEPYYRYVVNTEQFLLMIPVSFLVATVERVLRSFERETEECNILPFDDDG